MVPDRPRLRLFATTALVWTGLAALVGATFGVAAVLGAGTDLVVVAALVVAFAFVPARPALTWAANRVVYGHRLSPSQTVDRVALEMGGLRDPESQLSTLEDLLRRATGADRVQISIDPASTAAPSSAELVVPIVREGVSLGVIRVSQAGPAHRQLVADLAAKAAIVVHNLRLREALRRRVEVARRQQVELASARARTVAAQDAARRRLERDIHDSCQQDAVVVAANLGLVAARPGIAPVVVDEVAADLVRLRDSLRRISRGARPGILRREGLAAAIGAHTRGLSPPVSVADGLQRRMEPAVEDALYFAVLEAVQNAVRHAGASRIDVRLFVDGGAVGFRVVDDGHGFGSTRPAAGTGLRNTRDRLDSVGGDLTVRSSAGGTEVVASVALATDELSRG
jgi:signal transduction histidine kinase